VESIKKIIFKNI